MKFIDFAKNLESGTLVYLAEPLVSEIPPLEIRVRWKRTNAARVYERPGWFGWKPVVFERI